MSRSCTKCGIDIEHKRSQAKYCGRKCADKGRSRSGKRRKYSEFSEEKKIEARRKAVARAKKRREENFEEFRKKRAEASARYRKNNRERYLENRRLRERKTGKSKEEYLRDIRKNVWALNARQAWRYWLYVKASDAWLDRYYQATGKPWNDHRLTEAQKYRMRYRLDKEFNIAERIRRQVMKAKKRDGIGELIRYGLRNDGRSQTIERRLGYSIAQLKRHIERQFTKGMSWTRYMRGEIHIDHIIPQSSFNTADDSEWRECWSLSNLRPMWAADNLAKGSKIEVLL